MVMVFLMLTRGRRGRGLNSEASLCQKPGASMGRKHFGQNWASFSRAVPQAGQFMLKRVSSRIAQARHKSQGQGIGGVGRQPKALATLELLGSRGFDPFDMEVAKDQVP